MVMLTAVSADAQSKGTKRSGTKAQTTQHKSGGNRSGKKKGKQTYTNAQIRGLESERSQVQKDIKDQQNKLRANKADVEERHETGHVEDRTLADRGDDQRDAEEARVGKGAGERGDGIIAEHEAGNQDGQQEQRRGAARAVQDPQQMLRGALYQETVDDDGGQRQVDQDIAQGLAAFLGDLFRFEQRVAQSAQ